jgi:CheY-like chemotaxis protein
MRTENHRLRILLVDDDPNEALFIDRALHKTGLPYALQTVASAKDAITFFHNLQQPPPKHRQFHPDLILADLKMPVMTGLDLLQWLKQHTRWARIPTILLSNSAEPRDIDAAYSMGANSYLQKSSTIPEMIAQMHLLLQYWSACKRPVPG